MTGLYSDKRIGMHTMVNVENYSLTVECVIEDVKMAYGDIRFHVKPVSGSGVLYVSHGRCSEPFAPPKVEEPTLPPSSTSFMVSIKSTDIADAFERAESAIHDLGNLCASSEIMVILKMCAEMLTDTCDAASIGETK